MTEKIKKARSKDEEVVRVVEEMKKIRVKELKGDEWQIERDLVLKKEKIYVPKDKELRVEINTSGWTQGKVENNRFGDKKLLVAESNKRCREICGGVQYVSKNEEQNRSTSREVEVK